MKNTLSALLLFCSLCLNAQNELVTTAYDWEAEPAYSTSIETGVAMKALQEKYTIEYAYDDEGTFTQHYLEHKTLLLNSNDKIEEYNKIYLPYNASSALLKSKARVITASGEVIELDESKILTAQDNETGQNYKYFAFEGVEKGSIIEYFYVERKNPSYSGSTYRLQSDFQKTNVAFELYAPSNLVFEFKSYNGLPAVVQDTLSEGRSRWELKLDKIDALLDESQAPYTASRAALVYKLDKNLNSNKSDLSSYGNVAQNIYNYYYQEPDKTAQPLLDEFLEGTIKATDTDDAKIRKLDNQIKSGFILSEAGGDNLNDLTSILKTKIANSAGLIRLYVALMQQLEIKHELVITSDRTKIKFDDKFEAHNFLTDFLMYFPKQDRYLSPTELGTRYGYPPPYLTDNHGLFIKEVSVGSFTSAVGKIKFIKAVSADDTVDEMKIDVNFDTDDITTNEIKLSRSFSGYYALPIHPYMAQVIGEDRTNILEGLAKTINENVTVESMEVINEDPELFGVKPIIFELGVRSNALVEKAGRKYLFKVGDLIGPQVQMYQEKKRVLPLENEHTRSYLRTITITLPEGYDVVNLEDINIDNKYAEGGSEQFSFTSSYELAGNVLTIRADEFYRTNIVPPSNFNEFRKVINSAADFNKITLILEPKG
ncbi:DUF3857 domain-containing protein [Flagellimonas sp. DF-77]|uniref:DUF3857 domain-containing protein n=1 Tax=Flagellimonas algarum TaxID=3230298 RepID=UPI0033997A7D